MYTNTPTTEICPGAYNSTDYELTPTKITMSCIFTLAFDHKYHVSLQTFNTSIPRNTYITCQYIKVWCTWQTARWTDRCLGWRQMPGTQYLCVSLLATEKTSEAFFSTNNMTQTVWWLRYLYASLNFYRGMKTEHSFLTSVNPRDSKF